MSHLDHWYHERARRRVIARRNRRVALELPNSIANLRQERMRKREVGMAFILGVIAATCCLLPLILLLWWY